MHQIIGTPGFTWQLGIGVECLKKEKKKKKEGTCKAGEKKIGLANRAVTRRLLTGLAMGKYVLSGAQHSILSRDAPTELLR